jgi:hypothetical protein
MPDFEKFQAVMKTFETGETAESKPTKNQAGDNSAPLAPQAE